MVCGGDAPIMAPAKELELLALGVCGSTPEVLAKMLPWLWWHRPWVLFLARVFTLSSVFELKLYMRFPSTVQILINKLPTRYASCCLVLTGLVQSWVCLNSRWAQQAWLWMYVAREASVLLKCLSRKSLSACLTEKSNLFLVTQIMVVTITAEEYQWWVLAVPIGSVILTWYGLW